ncbi:Inherit from NOG: lipolytic protein G-D-S-L family [Seminavis robusta]|uniref:Inherit from NOG: lipolytic protein G-D-S-L family n=1 Tax=Seminavis robusta TaxID=568900 RepID=A0A9N8EXE7_9STRA|nr:Inherit from NOG: lipolytic protein G-D-S-L family [Seminavis robusta]|eukprot:Sro1839_g300880.1 Inherit from NOG: lipolytic protein G-D-S-L family (400) ;mRNA; f:7384-8583
MTKSKLLEATNYATYILGRHLLDQGAVKIDWPGVRLDFDGPFTQTSSIQVRMTGNGATFGYRLTPIGEDQHSLSKDEDNEFVIVSSRRNRMKDYPLLSLANATAKLDPNASYKLSIWKMGDPCNGGSTIAGLVVDNACPAIPAEKPCMSLPLPDRKLIEFVGDSNTVGYGIKGKRSGFFYHVLCEIPLIACFNAPKRLVKTTDATRSWAPLIAHALEADHHVIAWSGIGAQHSAWSNTTMNHAYGRLLASDPKTYVKELPGPPPDAVIVMIGQNDTVNTITNPARLQESFSTLLKQIRQYRPAPIPILLVVPTPDSSMACVRTNKENKKKATMLNQAWKSVIMSSDQDWSHVHLIENNHVPSLHSQDDYGMFLHWNESGNEKWARGLLPKVKGILKWDQ